MPAAPTLAAVSTDGSECGSTGLSLILPAHNEEPVIRRAIREAIAALAQLGIPWEVIVVDDGSTDATALVAWDESLHHRQVRVVSLPGNVGYGGALQQGFRAAQYELVAFTDADCQFDLNDLEKLVRLSRSADVVCGYRADRRDWWMRRVYSRGFNVLVRRLLGTGIQDCDCALKLFRRDWVNSIGLTAQGFFFNAEVLTRARQHGLRIAETPVAHRARQGGESKVSVAHVFPILVILLRFWWSQVVFPAGSRAEDHSNGRRSGWWTLACAAGLALLTAGVFLSRLSHPLIDPDESRYAQIAFEMFESGDLIVPTRSGRPYLDKPPLLYWLTALCYRAWGAHEASARLVAALAACATVIGTFCLGRLLVGRRAAAMGAVLLLTSVGFLISGRFLFMDTLLSLFTTVALLAGYAACRSGLARPALWYVSAMACGCGLLTKGPIAVLLCVPPIAASNWLTGGGPRLKSRDWLLYGVVASAIAAPWYLAIEWRHSGFLLDFIWTHHLQRFAGKLTHENPWWYYLPVLLIGTLPCSILFPATGLFLAARETSSRASRTWELGFLLLTSGWIVGLFSLSNCKLPPYLLPVLPPLCLVVGAALEAIVVYSGPRRFLSYVRENSPRDLAMILSLGAAIAAAIDLAWLGGLSASRLWLWATLVSAGVAVSWGLARRFETNSLTKWGVVALYTLVAMNYGVGMVFSDVAASRSSVAPIEALCRTLAQPPACVVGYSLGVAEDSLAFHFHGRPVRNFEPHETGAVVCALQSEPTTLLLANAAHFERLLEDVPARMQIVELGRHRAIVVAVSRDNPPEPDNDLQHSADAGSVLNTSAPQLAALSSHPSVGRRPGPVLAVPQLLSQASADAMQDRAPIRRQPTSGVCHRGRKTVAAANAETVDGQKPTR